MHDQQDSVACRRLHWFPLSVLSQQGRDNCQPDGTDVTDVSGRIENDGSDREGYGELASHIPAETETLY